MITTHGLTKRFGSFTAVDSLDLDVRAGDVYGFLGANGSGKTTTVRMLLGLVLATSGRAELFGQPMPKAARRVLPRVGALIEYPAAYGHLSGRANLAIMDASGPSGSRAARARRIEYTLERVGLAAVGKRPVRAYSLGMRQRLGLANALLRHPDLLILDEPTNGLDPQGIREIRELLLQLNREGTTVFLSSHLLAEVEQLCTRVGVLDRGRMVVQEQLADIHAPTGLVVVQVDDPSAARALLGDRIEYLDGGALRVRANDAAALNESLVRHGIAVTELRAHRRTLEEVVMSATHAGSDRVDGHDEDGYDTDGYDVVQVGR